MTLEQQQMYLHYMAQRYKRMNKDAKNTEDKGVKAEGEDGEITLSDETLRGMNIKVKRHEKKEN